MSRIVSPVPLVMTITVNELTGMVDWKTSRDVPFPTVAMIFAQLQLKFCEEHFRQEAAAAAAIAAGLKGLQKNGS
jgi:hypothetical protein